MVDSVKHDRMRDAGTVLIIIGVGLWVVYAVGKYWIGWDVTDRDFLPYHLAAIIPGMVLRYYRVSLDRVREWFSAGGRDGGA